MNKSVAFCSSQGWVLAEVAWESQASACRLGWKSRTASGHDNCSSSSKQLLPQAPAAPAHKTLVNRTTQNNFLSPAGKKQEYSASRDCIYLQRSYYRECDNDRVKSQRRKKYRSYSFFTNTTRTRTHTQMLLKEEKFNRTACSRECEGCLCSTGVGHSGWYEAKITWLGGCRAARQTEPHEVSTCWPAGVLASTLMSSQFSEDRPFFQVFNFFISCYFTLLWAMVKIWGSCFHLPMDPSILPGL